ncbi:MAG TPA: DUF6782 family putative metallopeptidase [Gemmatimonadales bacterium]|nr:DUF6782 family putative metallopeptidase [Gemmatimonadales bacterium]
MRRTPFALILLAALACGRHPAESQTSADVHRILATVIPKIEKTVGLTFKTPPVVEIRTRAQVNAYLKAKLAHDLPPALLEHERTAYVLFRFIPDTLDLQALLLNVLSEQVMGYYDPDSAALFVVDGTDPAKLQLVLGHELVHALQGQYVPLDSILSQETDGDRRAAAQAVMEGQATLASVDAMVSKEQMAQLPNFWNDFRDQIREAQRQMPVFASAPLVVRESLIFPYVDGAEFMRWFDRTYPDTVPYGPRLPVSTEEILHPDRYRAGDRPVTLRFRDSTEYSDDLGELGARMLLQQLSGSSSLGNAGALDWGGDRYALFPAGTGTALVWWSVWDDAHAADRFATLLRAQWGKLTESGRRWSVDRMDVSRHPGVRFVDAPTGWPRWKDIPGVEVARDSSATH